jgi:hypothetical protein
MGLNKLRFLQDVSGLPYRMMNDNVAIFSGNKDVIDTGISINGDENDFSIMMSFSLPKEDTGENQYIANGTGRRFVFMMHKTGEALNSLYIGFGSQIFQVTLDTSLSFHAMIVTWNKTNGVFKFAIDGNPLSQDYPGDFYSFTNYFYLGAYNNAGDYSFSGYIGGGIMSSNIIDEATWLDFWENNKNKIPYDGDFLIDCDNYRFCEEHVRCGIPNFLDCEEFLECTDEINCWH